MDNGECRSTLVTLSPSLSDNPVWFRFIPLQFFDNMEKTEPAMVDHQERNTNGDLAHWGTNIDGDAAALSPEHRAYLMQRHGTVELDPMPGYGNADPLNWARWKVCAVSLLLCCLRCMSFRTIADRTC